MKIVIMTKINSGLSRKSFRLVEFQVLASVFIKRIFFVCLQYLRFIATVRQTQNNVFYIFKSLIYFYFLEVYPGFLTKLQVICTLNNPKLMRGTKLEILTAFSNSKFWNWDRALPPPHLSSSPSPFPPLHYRPPPSQGHIGFFLPVCQPPRVVFLVHFFPEGKLSLSTKTGIIVTFRW